MTITYISNVQELRDHRGMNTKAQERKSGTLLMHKVGRQNLFQASA